MSGILGFLVLAFFYLQPAFAFSSGDPIQDPVAPETRKCDRSHPVSGYAVVERGVDGDTVYIKVKEGSYKVRLIGIDTPETYFMGQSQGEWGERAKERLKELLPTGTRIRLELSPSVCDSYGRILAHIFKGKMHINREIVKEGLAVNYCLYPSVSYCEELGVHTEQAMARRIGMFSDPDMEIPYDFRRRVSGRRQSSFTGNLSTKEVFRPGGEDRVPVGKRIFFSREGTIPPPYHIVD